MLNKSMKRMVSALLVMALAFSLLPLSAFAAEQEQQTQQYTPYSAEHLRTVLELMRQAEPATAVQETEAVQSVVAKRQPKKSTVSAEQTFPNTEDDGHEHIAVESEQIPALCEDTGLTAGTYCSLCGVTLSGRFEIPALGHAIVTYEASPPTFSSAGWEAFEDCGRCGYSTYVEIPKLETPILNNYDMFVFYLTILEEAANSYVLENPGKDPLELMIKYIRTGVERYNSGSWGIMAGYEDADFAAYVAAKEDEVNKMIGDPSQMVAFTSLKKLDLITLPNGNVADLGHMFGTMDITYHNKGSQNHADVGGWSGDLADLLEFADQGGVTGTVEEMAAIIRTDYLLKTPHLDCASYSQTDFYGDLDAMMILNPIMEQGYYYDYDNYMGSLTIAVTSHFTPELSDAQRVNYLLKNRLGGVSNRLDIRDAVYNAYTSNKMIATLEDTREYITTDLTDLRRAVCYAYADYICSIAGDYVENVDNDLYTVFSTEKATLAPGVTQQTKMATNANGEQIVYYLATADITRDDVNIYANYNENDPTLGWKMSRVLDQANAAQARHSDPSTEHYIENYNVVAAINGAGFNMHTGQPSGLLVMEGVTYSPINDGGFFGILKDGTAVIASTEEYNNIYKDQVQEGIAGFGSRLIEDGKIVEGLDDDLASRTAIGITKTGKVVFMVLDGRQAPFSSGGGYATLAQILYDAGCVQAVNLDGGGSTTFVAKMPGDEELSVVNRPSDGYARSVSTSLIVVSTAPSSTAFDHAVLETESDYMTVGVSTQVTAAGISPSGNTVDMPEGATWAVSDSSIGTVDENGVFTALAKGTVDIQILLDGQVVGSRTVYVVTPNNLYFTKTNMDTVYGSSAALPIKMVYNNNDMLFLPGDVQLSLSNSKAGAFDGLNFLANSNENCGIKNVTVTASLPDNSKVNSTITIAIYKQGETTFDFDQATGGDRLLAWYRQVSNAEENDGIYTVIDASESMETTYTLAIDMTQIPIPKVLEDLTYMLPGSDVAGASAWTFLCNLAERISGMSQIKATVSYDPNMVMDISEMALINDYFTLTNVEHDEENCTLTLTLNWIKRSQAINVDSANALCIVNGLKLTPKADAQWDSDNTIDVINSGNISYTIYMRASSLYTFASKPENQETYGLFAYMNPEDSYDRGGAFSNTYTTFADSYTLVNQLKEGWHNEENGFAYYVAGAKVKGVCKVDGLYYNFGEDGILATKTPYTGLFTENEKTFYAKLGEPVTGWHNVGEDWYLFNWQTAEGVDGIYNNTIDGVAVTYELDNGKLIKGYWHENENGLQYFYGPYYYKQGWKTIDGEQYYFEEYYAATGVYPTRPAHATYATWYAFTDAGVMIGLAENGVYEFEGELYYVEDALTQFSGLYEFEDAYYYANSDGTLKADTTCWISYTRGVIPAGTYRFAADGKIVMTTELVDENGTLYYYKNGVRTANAGLVAYQGDIYLIGPGATITKDTTRWVSKTNGLKPAGEYTFDADGKLVVHNGIVDGYYYVDGVKTSAGMICVDGDYYFATNGGRLKANEISWCSYNNDLLPAGTYRFGADGKIIMTTELVNENGTLYYYQNGKRTANAGLAVYEGDIYLVGDGAMITRDVTRWVSKTNGLKPAGEYTFDTDGKLVIYNGIVNGYYYVDGTKTAAGMLLINGEYYFAANGGKLKANESSWCSRNNNLLPAGTYRFGADGKIIMTTELVNENGTLYYYQNGKRTANAGLAVYEGDIYLVGDGAMVTKNVTRYVSRTNGLKPAGTYTFDAEGKLVIYNGIVDGYYFVDGIKTAAGMLLIDGEYYFAANGGKLKVSESAWCSRNNDLLPAGTYRFDAEGKIIMTTELVNENGTLYYYQNGKRTANAGLAVYEGDIYLVGEGAMVTKNVTRYVSKTNGLMPAGTYTFDAEGKLVN